MTVEQIVEIPASRRITLDVPPEVPTGRTILSFTPAPVKSSKTREEQEIEYINRNAERLNKEMLDVLSYQSLEL